MRVSLSVLVISALTIFWGARSAVASDSSATSYLVVSPDEGHASDFIYLTGVGFPPNESEVITMACPQATVANEGYEVVPGPTTDDHGNFVRFKFHALTPTDQKTRVTCTIYASVASNDFGPDIPAHYLIFPRAEKLDAKARTITGSQVHATPVRVRSGLIEKIVVRNPRWRGAFTDVEVRYPHMRPIHRYTSLDYLGNASVQIMVTFRVPVPNVATALVHVQLRLGSWTGGGKTKFSVIH